MMNDKCGGGPSFKLCIDTLDNTAQCHSINILPIVHKITAWTNIRAHSAMLRAPLTGCLHRQCSDISGNIGLFWANRKKSFSHWLKCKMLPSGISVSSQWYAPFPICPIPSQSWEAVTAQLPGNIKMSGRWCDGDVWMVIVSGDQLEYYDYHTATAQHRWGWGGSSGADIYMLYLGPTFFIFLQSTTHLLIRPSFWPH